MYIDSHSNVLISTGVLNVLLTMNDDDDKLTGAMKNMMLGERTGSCFTHIQCSHSTISLLSILRVTH